MANPTLTPFPTPPLPEQDEVTFNRNAANSLLAQANFVGEANTVVTWMGQQVDSVSTNAAAALKSSKDAATSATGASGSADAAANSASQAQTYAAAAGAAAGAPSISGKADYMYSVNAAGTGTEWRVAPLRPTAARAGMAVAYNAAGNAFEARAFPLSPITQYFESSPMAITGGSVLSINHGFGVRPKIVMIHLVCTQALQGYSIGDIIELAGHATSSTSYQNLISVSYDATKISVVINSNANIFVLPKGGNAPPTGYGVGAYFNMVIRGAA